MVETLITSTEQQTISKEYLQKTFAEPPAPTVERQMEIQRHLASVSKVLSAFEHPWYIRGGLSLEIGNESFLRDHGDVDIAIRAQDAKALWEYLHNQSPTYTFWTHTNEQITSLDQFTATKKDFGIVVHKDNELFFEILFLRQNQDGTHQGPDGIILPEDIYDTHPRLVTLLHKVLTGRQKDFIDIQRVLPSLTTEEKRMLEKYLFETGVTFEIDGETTSNLYELIDLADKKTAEIFEEHVDTLISNEQNQLLTELHNITNRIFPLTQNCSTRPELALKLEQEFGSEKFERHKSQFDVLLDYIGDPPAINKEQLVQKVREIMDWNTRLYNQTIAELQGISRWETISIHNK